MQRGKSLQPFQKRLQAIVGKPIKVKHLLNKSQSLQLIQKIQNQKQSTIKSLLKDPLKRLKSIQSQKNINLKEASNFKQHIQNQRKLNPPKFKKIQLQNYKTNLLPLRIKTQAIQQKQFKQEENKSKHQNNFKRSGFERCKAKSISLQKIQSHDSLNKVEKFMLKPLKRQISLKSIAKNRQIRNNLLKIEFPEKKQSLKLNQIQSLRQIIPKIGYQHLKLPFEMQDAMECTISENGIMITYEKNQTFFYKVEQFQKYLVKINKLKKIQFFQKFFLIKCLKRWKIIAFKHYFITIQSFINKKVPLIYCKQIEQLTKIYSLISTYKYIKNGDSAALQLPRYAIYLHDNSYLIVKKITTEYFKKIIQIFLYFIKKKLLIFSQQKLQKLQQYHLFKIKRTKKAQKLKLTNQVKEDLKNKKQNVFQFKNELEQVQLFLKKVFYNFGHFYVQWVTNITTEIISKLNSLFENYVKIKDRTKQKLKYIFNRHQIDYNEEKYFNYDSQMRQILYKCSFVANKNGEKIIQFNLTEEDVIYMFQEFADHIIQKLGTKQILNCYKNQQGQQYRQGKINQLYTKQSAIQFQILSKIVDSIDVYSCQNLLHEKQILNIFKQKLKNLVHKNIAQAKQIIELLNGIMSDVFDYYNTQNKDTSYILSYTILQETKSKILLIPDELMIGLFVFNIQDIKTYSNDLIEQSINNLTKDLPAQFRNCYQNLYENLNKYCNNINLTVWTIKQFINSYRWKQMFEQYREDQIYKDQDKLKNFLTAVNKTIPKTYEECYLMSLKIKEIIQKIDIKIQTFDLNVIKKLKHFKTDIQSFSTQIYNKLITLRNQISKIDDFQETQFIQKTLLILPVYEQQLLKIKQQIQGLNYIQNLQIRFGLKQDLTADINLFQKSESDVKLIKSILNNYIQFQERIKKQMSTDIMAFNSDNIVEQFSNNESHIKTSEKYLISFFKLLKKIHNNYNNHMDFISTANQLSNMNQNQIIDILNNFNTHPIRKNQKITLQKLKQFKIQKHKEQINYNIQKKQKKKKMELILAQIETSINQLCLLAQVINSNQNIRTNINLSQNEISKTKLNLTIQSNLKVNKLQVNYFAGFINIVNNIKIIKQIQSELNQLVLSPFLQQQKKQLFFKLQYVTNIINFIQSVEYCQKKVFKLIKQGVFKDNSQLASTKQKIFDQNQFQKYKQFKLDPKLEKEVAIAWQYLLRKFHGKKINQISFYLVQYKIQVVNFLNSIQSVQKLVTSKINEKKCLFNLLYLFNNQTILKFICDPLRFIFNIFPTKKCQRIEDKTFILTSVYNQKIQIQLNCQNTMFIKAFYQKCINQLKNIFQQNLQKTPIDHINFFCQCSIPLQIVFILDQLSLQSKFDQFQKEMFVHNIVGQTKMISKILRNECQYQKFHYKNILVDLLIGSRIQFRHRALNYTTQNLWNQIMVLQIDKNKKVKLRNLNNTFPINYVLYDSRYLTFYYPGCEKTFFKICESFSGQFPCAYIQNSQILKTFCSRTMNLLIQIQYDQQQVEDLGKGIILNNNIASLITFSEKISHLDIAKLIRFVKKERLQFQQKKRHQNQCSQSRINNLFSNTIGMNIPSIFVKSNFQFQQLSNDAKIFFKELNYFHPNYQLILLTKLQMAQIDFLHFGYEIIHYIKGYFKIYEQLIFQIPSHNFVVQFIDRIIESLKFKKQSQYCDVVYSFLIQYYANIGCSQELLLQIFNINYQKNLENSIRQKIIGKEFNLYQQSQKKIKKKFQETNKTLLAKQNLINFIDERNTKQYHQKQFYSKLQEIINIIINNKQNLLKICIFGNRASGKTTIIKLLKEYLLQNKLIQSFQAYHQIQFCQFQNKNGVYQFKNILNIKQMRKDHLFSLTITSQKISLLMDSLINFFQNQTKQLNRKKHQTNNMILIFELGTICCISPDTFLNANKVYLPSKFSDPQFYFQKWSKNLLLKYEIPQHNQTQKYDFILISCYSHIKDAFHLIINQSISFIQWNVAPNFSNILGTTLKLFDSFIGFQKMKLQALFFHQRQNIILKVLFYCLFWSLIYCVQQSGYQIIQKILKEHFYKISEQKQKQNFLYKILKVENNQCRYEFIKVLSEQGQMPMPTTNNFQVIIQNSHMKCFNFFTNKLKINAINILVLGKQELGKSIYLQNYLNKYNQGIYIKLKTFNQNLINVLQKQIKNFRKKKENIYQKKQKYIKQPKICQLIVWIQGVQLYHNISPIQKYLKFLSQYKQNLSNKEKVALENVNYFIERKQVTSNYLKQNWSIILMSIAPTQQNFQGIFTEYLLNILNKFVFFNSTFQQLKSQIPLVINQHFVLMRFYKDSYKQSSQNWTYWMSYGKYKRFIQEFFQSKELTYFSSFSSSEIVFKLNFNLFFTLYCLIKKKKNQETFLCRISNFLDIGQNLDLNYISFNDQLSQRENILTIENQEQRQVRYQKISLKIKEIKIFKNILTYPLFCKNFQTLKYALSIKSHLMINKVIISRQYSFLQIVLQILNLNWSKIALSNSEKKFNEQINKSILTNANSEKLYLYISYQAIKLNPNFLEWISRYIQNTKFLCEDQVQKHLKKQTQVIFVLEYSDFQLKEFGNFLRNKILNKFTSIHYKFPHIMDYNQIGLQVLIQKFRNEDLQLIGSLNSLLNKCFLEVNLFNIKQYSLQLSLFTKQYVFSLKNYIVFLIYSVQIYLKRIGVAQLKRNSLQFTLSEINGLIRQHKNIKLQQEEYSIQKKKLIVQIQASRVQMQINIKKLNKLILQSKQTGTEKIKQTICQKQQYLLSLQNNQIKMNKKVHLLSKSLNRTELAQLKYLFVNNFELKKQMFSCICIILDESQQYSNMKKCVMDVSLLSRLSDIKVDEVQYNKIIQIKKTLQVLQFQKNIKHQLSIIDWFKAVAQYRIIKQVNKTKIPDQIQQIQKLKQQLASLQSINQIDAFEHKIDEIKIKIQTKKGQLEKISLKLRQINKLLFEISQFQELGPFQKRCVQFKDSLQQGSINFIYYSVLQASEVIFFSLFNQTIKNTFKSNLVNILRRKFTFSSNKAHLDIFQMLEKDEQKVQQVIKLKRTIPYQMAKLIKYLNKVLAKDKQTIIIIDPHDSFKSLVNTEQTFIVDFNRLGEYKYEIIKYKCLIINLENQNWQISVKQLSKNTNIHKKIIQYNNNTIVVPGQIKIIFRKTQIGKYTELMHKFKMIRFQITEQNYYELIKTIIIEELVISKKQTSLFSLTNKADVANQKFMNVVMYFCKNKNKIQLSNVNQINNALLLINQWKIALIQIRGFQYQAFQQTHQNQKTKKIYRNLSKVFKIVENYFPISNLNAQYFLSAVQTGSIYCFMSFQDQRGFILYYALSMVVYSLQNINLFLAFFYLKVISMQQKFCTMIQSQNLVYAFSELDQLEGTITNNLQNQTFNYFKYLPYQNKESENFVRKLLAKKKQYDQCKILELIQAQQNFTYYQKLLFKKILVPKQFDKQIQERTKQIQKMIKQNNLTMNKQFFQHGLLYCECDIYFWKKNMTLKIHYYEVHLSKLDLQNTQYQFQFKPYFIIDDFEERDIQFRNIIIQKLKEFKHMNSVIFSHLKCQQKLQQKIKKIPFLLFLQIYGQIDPQIIQIGKNQSFLKLQDEDISSLQISYQTIRRNLNSQQSEKQQQTETKQHKNDNCKNGFINQHYKNIICRKQYDEKSIMLTRFLNHISQLVQFRKTQGKLVGYYYWKHYIWYQQEDKLQYFNFKESFIDNPLKILQKQYISVNSQKINQLFLKPDLNAQDNAQKLYKLYFRAITKHIANIQKINQKQSQNIYHYQIKNRISQITKILDSAKDIANFSQAKNNLDSQKITDYNLKKKKFSLKKLNQWIIELAQFQKYVQNSNASHLDLDYIKNPLHLLVLFSKPAFRILIVSKQDFSQSKIVKQNTETEKSIRIEKSGKIICSKPEIKQLLNLSKNNKSKQSQKIIKFMVQQQTLELIGKQDKMIDIKQNDQDKNQGITSIKSIQIKKVRLNQQQNKNTQLKNKMLKSGTSRKANNIYGKNLMYSYNNFSILFKPIEKKQSQKMDSRQLCKIKLSKAFYLTSYFIKDRNQQICITLFKKKQKKEKKEGNQIQIIQKEDKNQKYKIKALL